MSERYPHSSETRFTRRGKAIMAGVAVAAALGSAHEIQSIQADNKLVNQLQDPNAYENYQKGLIDPSQVVVIEAPKDSTAWQLAGEIVNKDTDVRDVVQEISPQVDAQNYPGVQSGEHVVVKRDQINPDNVEALQNGQ